MLASTLLVLASLQCDTPAYVQHIDAATLGSTGPPRISASGAPLLDGAYSLAVDNAAASTLGLFAYDTVATPVPLPTFGTTLYVDLAAQLLVFTVGPNGTSNNIVHLDSISAAFCGLDIVAQAAVFDANAPGGLAFTDALTIGFGVASGDLYPGSPVLPGTGSHAIAVDDFDLDGIRDIATIDANSGTLRVALGSGLGMFEAGPELPIGTESETIVANDHNGDANPDLILLENNPPRVTLLEGAGDGSFTPQWTAAVGAVPSALAVRDIDGDGRLDVAVANTAGSVSMFLGAGDGTFTPTTSFALASSCFGIEFADMDSDGLPDLVATMHGLSELHVHLGLGGASFGAATVYATEIFPAGVVIEDLNGDGWKDAVVGNDFFNFSVAVRLGVGGGLLGSAAAYPVGGPANGQSVVVRVANIDSDATPDILVGTRFGFGGLATKQLSVLRGLGDGTFLPEEAYPMGATYDILPSSEFALADMNQDGATDVVQAGNDTRVYFGVGDGTFAHDRRIAVVADTEYVALGDMNSDGLADLVVGGDGSGVQVLTSDGAGGFATSAPITSTFGHVSTPDVNGDGALDIVASQVDVIVTLLNQGGGSFVEASTFSAGGGISMTLASDFDLDGNIDLAALHPGEASPAFTKILTGDGSGSFIESNILNTGGYTPSIDVGHVNGDSLPDLVIAYHDPGQLADAIQVHLGDGNGGFAPPANVATTKPLTIALHDIDDDGDLDLISTRQLSSQLSVFRGAGDGTFGSAEVYSGSAALALDFGDINADGIVDVLGTQYGGNVVAFLGQGDGNLTDGFIIPAPGTAFSIAVHDFDRDGLLDLAVPGGEDNEIALLLNQLLGPN